MAVQAAFAMAMKGMDTKEISKTLNRDGFRTSTGAHWTNTYVYKVLTNEAYCGTMLLGGRSGHRASWSGEPPVRVENAWLAIVDRETFLSVQQKMASRRPKVVHPRVLQGFYLLSGILFCRCGKAMIGRSAKSHRYYYYTCNSRFKEGTDSCYARSLPKKQLESTIIEHIKSKILDDATVAKLVTLINEDLDKAHSSYHDRLEVIDTEVRDVNARLAVLHDALETGKLDLDDLAPRIKELKIRQDEFFKSRVLFEADMTLHGVQHVDVNRVKAYCNDLRSLLSESDIVNGKSFLRLFVEKIVIDGTKCTVHYKLPVPVTWQENDETVLPIEPLSGAGVTIGRTFSITFHLT